MSKEPVISWKLKWAIALAPWICLVALNEVVRWSNTQSFEKSETIVLNSSDPIKGACSWHCHDNTTYCKVHHVRWANGYFKWIDPMYFGIIKLLGSTGDYGLANLVFLVVAWPLLIYFLLVKVITNRKRLKKLKSYE